MSLRFKIAMWTMAVSLLLQGVGQVFVLIRQRDSIDRFFNMRIEARSTLLLGYLQQDAGELDDQRLQRAIDKLPQTRLFEDFVYTIFTAEGKVVATSRRPAPQPQLVRLSDAVASGQTVTGRLRPFINWTEAYAEWGRRSTASILREDHGAPMVLTIVGDDRYAKALFEDSLLHIATTFLIGGCATGLASWLIAGIATTPLRSVRRMAEALEPERLHQPVDVRVQGTEVTEIREQIAVTRAKLQDAFGAQERFLINVSHELRTPIAVVMTEADTLSNRRTPEEVDSFVASVRDEMKRLGSLVNSFLTLANVQSGKPLTNPHACQMNEFVMEAIRTCRPDADAKGITLDPTLTTDEATVHGDTYLLRVMVENLLRNAVQVTPSGHTIPIGVEVVNQEGRLSIGDFGPSLSPEMLEHAFDRFPHSGGGGDPVRKHRLGLSVARGIAELHGGSISVINRENGGCVFTAHLPVRQHAAGGVHSAGAR